MTETVHLRPLFAYLTPESHHVCEKSCTFAPMKHLVIRNLGPLKEADVELKRINVIIGSQSSGKSCVLKTACYCTWVEKRIELTQTADFFAKDGNFLRELERFHKLKGYVKPDTFISYESDFMAFSFDNATNTFKFDWKDGRWNYKRSKVTYIPAERNLVAAIPNWFQVKFNDDNIRDFMADWETARQATTGDLTVLNLGVSYHYDANTKSDKVKVSDGVTLDFTNTSSGLQSVIPLFVHLSHITKIKHDRIESFANLQENSVLLAKLDEEDRKDVYTNYVHTHHCDIFLEEPEANLFPPTQSNLVEWLFDMAQGKQPSNIFIATHSPYILGTFLEKKNIDLTLLYTRVTDGLMTVMTATEQDLQDIYDYGVDVFFNIETLG